MRTAAAVLYSNTGSYDTVCDSSSNAGLIFASAFNQSAKENALSMCLESDTGGVWASGGTLVVIAKTATPDKWAAAIRLPNTGNYFCVDYTGIAREQAGRGIDNSPVDVDCL